MKDLDPSRDPATPDALRLIAKRLESDDMVEWVVLNGAADEIERLRSDGTTPICTFDMEKYLHRLMKNPRYWRDQEPKIVAEVRKGFMTLYE